MARQRKLQVDMWYGDKFVARKYYADVAFYPHGSFGYCYRGNIYDAEGKIVGDYDTNDSALIEKKFKLGQIK